MASRRAGRVSREQLNALGISDDAIAVRVRTGRLIRLHPGVYAIDRRDDARARHWAAHLADGIRIHTRRLEPDAIRVVDGLPLTSPSQTLFDLTTVLGQDALRRAANEAFVRQLVTAADLHATLAANSRRKGAAAFRRLLAGLRIAGRVRSPLEIRLHEFLRARGFPPFESNVRLRIGGEWIEPDVLWREQRVFVEADGRGPHLAPLTFASDRRRDRRARVEEWTPVRVTEEDLAERPDELDSDLRSILGALRRQ